MFKKNSRLIQGAVLFASFVTLVDIKAVSANELEPNLGFLTEKDEYVALVRSGDTYFGSLSKYSKEGGITYTEVSAKLIEDGNLLRLVGRSGNPSEAFVATYYPKKIDQNSVWLTHPSAINSAGAPEILQGTTLKVSNDAYAALVKFEKNIAANSIPYPEFSKFIQTATVFCRLVSSRTKSSSNECLNEHVPSGPKIGIVMEQSQVGFWDMIASAFGTGNSVQTFVSGKNEGAMLMADAETVLAAATLSNKQAGAASYDFSNNLVVKTSYTSPPSSVKRLRWRSKGVELFDKINMIPRKLTDINMALTGFARVFSPHVPNCSYHMDESTPYVKCLNHSSDLKLSNSSAWLESYFLLEAKETSLAEVEITAYAYFTIKYDKLSTQPNEKTEFEIIDYSRDFERNFAEASLDNLTSVLRTLYEDKIDIVSRK